MNEEIKKILDYLKDENDYIELHGVKYKKLYMNNLIIDDNEVSVLLDYVTNLQEENEKLKDYLKIMEKAKDNNLNRFLDYKSRCEKAIDKISKLKPFIPNEIPSWLDELENILNGGDE